MNLQEQTRAGGRTLIKKIVLYFGRSSSRCIHFRCNSLKDMEEMEPGTILIETDINDYNSDPHLTTTESRSPVEAIINTDKCCTEYALDG